MPPVKEEQKQPFPERVRGMALYLALYLAFCLAWLIVARIIFGPSFLSARHGTVEITAIIFMSGFFQSIFWNFSKLGREILHDQASRQRDQRSEKLAAKGLSDEMPPVP